MAEARIGLDDAPTGRSTKTMSSLCGYLHPSGILLLQFRTCKSERVDGQSFESPGTLCCEETCVHRWLSKSSREMFLIVLHRGTLHQVGT